MDKELIKNNIKEFTAWIQGNSVLIGSPTSMINASKGILSWREVELFDDWSCLDAKYVINDEYAEFRKALAEGKQLELNDGYPNIESNKLWNLAYPDKTPLETYPVRCYRIKPDEPKLKVDTKVIVWDKYTEKNKAKRYFSHFNNSGKICCFEGGATSWSIHDKEATCAWDNWELAE